MKIYIRDNHRVFILDEKWERKYVEITPCDDCKKFQWENIERLTVQKAVDLMWSLVVAQFNIYHRIGGFIGSADWRITQCFNELINPVRELSEYDSYQIGLIVGALQFAGFAGIPEMNFRQVKLVDIKIQHFIRHISDDHSKENTIPTDYFRDEYFFWVTPKFIFEILGEVHGSSCEEILAYFKKVHDSAESYDYLPE